MRTYIDQSQRRLLDDNFNLKSFRSQAKDKWNLSLTSDLNQSSFNSVRKENRQGVPSFDNLQVRIRDLSQSRQTTLNYNSNDNFTPQKNLYSPHKAYGMRQIIQTTLGQNTMTNSNEKQPQNSKSQSSQQKLFQRPSDPLQLPLKGSSRKQGRLLSDAVQLNEIVALRNRIESSVVSRSSLTSTYISELVKLAQSITTSLKQE
ncbi:unnamed protein product (macronuclear) [Paramecium tetraurelia]|uniref:Uncharacterized protein n=1 Tax=Paramecium tetraurelia TaxID=5888 RepID=A0C6X3_PARTE|nr:uncharacterized protein GSPATT00035669001 [Paramecium tetraurelia]CAK66540.1 unnamed protein product [Paramecium tetraurelia]|eukprot:XP_001433937.1 hypothetical protein (macronuclear) [Paramecium tetraurelia strain d4-2]